MQFFYKKILFLFIGIFQIKYLVENYIELINNLDLCGYLSWQNLCTGRGRQKSRARQEMGYQCYYHVKSTLESILWLFNVAMTEIAIILKLCARLGGRFSQQSRARQEIACGSLWQIIARNYVQTAYCIRFNH